MSLAVDNPILNNHFLPQRSDGADEEQKEYRVYNERQLKRS